MPTHPLENAIMDKVMYELTADGDLAARVAHLVLGLIPMKDGTMRMLGTMTDAPVERVRRSDFFIMGYAPSDEAAFRAEVEDTAEHHREIAALGRPRIDRNALRGVWTPWEDEADGGRRYANGIVSLDTPGHGGFALSRAMNDQVHPAWRAECGSRESAIDDVLDPGGVERAKGALPGAAFYEEDEMWAVVAHTFPDLFTARERRQAESTLKRSMPDEWEQVTGETIPYGVSLQRDRRLFLEAHADCWIVTSAIDSRINVGMTLVHAHLGGRQRNGGMNGAPRLYLLPSTEYLNRRRRSGVDECVINTITDILVDSEERSVGASDHGTLDKAA
jgi:hypothetical protein